VSCMLSIISMSNEEAVADAYHCFFILHTLSCLPFMLKHMWERQANSLDDLNRSSKLL